MPIFIFLCLVLSILVKLQNPYHEWFKNVEMMYLGSVLAAIAIITWLLKQPRWLELIKPYDWFAVGALLIWFQRWHLFYRDDAPMFYIFPFFFAIVTALVTFFYIDQAEKFDPETIGHFQYFADLVKYSTGFIVAGVLLSLFLTNHFILYPVMMMIYLFRFTLTTCLQNANR